MHIEELKYPRPLKIWLIAIGVCLIVTTIVYLPSLDAKFYFDDLQNIEIASALHWEKITWANFIDGMRNTYAIHRPVANLSFALNHLFGGLNPKGYHLANLLVHLATGLTLAWVSFMLTFHRGRTETDHSTRFILAFMISLLFLVHPLNIQAVTYVVQRMTSMSALFFLLAFGCYLYARNWAGKSKKIFLYFFCVLFWLIALGCKEIAFVFPLVIIVYEYAFHHKNLVEKIRQVISNRKVWKLATVVLLGLFVLALFMYSYIEPTFGWNETFASRNYNGYQRVLTQSRVQVFYLSLLFWPAPSRLNLDHNIRLSKSFYDPLNTVPAILFWIIVILLALFLLHRYPFYGFPLMMYLVLHLIESGPINLELIFEHRMYLPMTALAMLATNAILDLRMKRRLIVWVILGVLIFPLSFAAYSRNLTWSDSIAFHYDTASKSPEKFRPQYNLGTELGKLSRCGEAIKALTKALTIKPKDSMTYNQLGNCYLLTGLIKKASQKYEQAVLYNPQNAEAVYNLATVYFRMKKFERSKNYFEKFLLIAPPYLKQYQKNARRRLMMIKNYQ